MTNWNSQESWLKINKRWEPNVETSRTENEICASMSKVKEKVLMQKTECKISYDEYIERTLTFNLFYSMQVINKKDF